MFEYQSLLPEGMYPQKREETGKPNRNQQNWDGSVKMERNQQINMKINKLPMAVF
jgi:hypothetical protein